MKFGTMAVILKIETVRHFSNRLTDLDEIYTCYTQLDLDPAILVIENFIVFIKSNRADGRHCIRPLVKLEFHDADTDIPTRTSSRGSSPTSPTGAISLKLFLWQAERHAPTFSRRSSRGCRCPCRRRGTRALPYVQGTGTSRPSACSRRSSPPPERRSSESSSSGI